MANDLFKKLMSFQDTRPPVPLMDPNAEDEPTQEDFEVAQEPIQLGQIPKPDLAQRQAVLNGVKSFRAPAVNQKSADESELEQHLASMEKADTDRVDQEIASADFDQAAMEPMFPEEAQTSSMSPREKLLSDYQRLMQAQKAHQGNLGNLAMLQGANTIAQGFALGRGAKIGNNAEGIAALEKASGQAPKDIMDQMKLGGTDTNDPQSDISRFARAQAAKAMATKAGKLDPELEQKYNEDFSEMSAAQLQKLGFKNILGSGMGNSTPWTYPDNVMTKDGRRIMIHRGTGQMFDALTQEPLPPDTEIISSIARKDALTENYGYAGPKGLQVMPTDYSAVGIKPKQKIEVNSQGQPVTQVEVPKFADFAKASPKQAEEFRKLQKDFTQDMKDSRDVATAITNIKSKLKPGPLGKVDAGNLGSVQTQAAKMSGQKGVLTDQDLVKFAGAGGVAAKIERIIDGTFFGDMTDTDIKFFNRFADLMTKSLDSDIQNRAQLYKHQGRQIVETSIPGITDDTIGEWFGVDKVAPITQNKQVDMGDTVKIQGPSGQVVTIKKDAAEKYLKKPGYKLVK